MKKTRPFFFKSQFPIIQTIQNRIIDRFSIAAITQNLKKRTCIPFPLILVKNLQSDSNSKRVSESYLSQEDESHRVPLQKSESALFSPAVKP